MPSQNEVIRERIFKSCRTIPAPNLINYIKNGTVTLSELIAHGLPQEKVDLIRSANQANDDSLWTTCTSRNSVEAYKEYLALYSDGIHRDEALAALSRLDDEIWTSSQMAVSEATMRDYLAKFPNGKHVAECQALLNDLPWLEAKRINTISGYEQYRMQHPGLHDAEINQLINALNDDKDWNDACIVNTSDAYNRYLMMHPNGNHAWESQNRIQASAGHDQYIRELMEDPNSHDAVDIQMSVGNGIISWDDIARVFGYEKCNMIQGFMLPADLPEGTPPDMLEPNSTEVYFWGTPSSGKTCALGSILSTVKRNGAFEPLPCKGFDYMTRLGNLFTNHGFCTFPNSTNVENIQEMILKLTDEDGKQHKMTLIDLAGELFRSAYFKQNNLFLQEDKEAALNKAISYLNDNRNEKIHFFVVEYGAHNKMWEGLYMDNYLTNMVTFLKHAQIFRKSTVGIYVLVTKCDKMNCSPEQRPQKAYEYIQENFQSFWNMLDNACKDDGVQDLKTLAFSVGDVFAQNLCQFDGTDTSKVIDKLLTKTPTEKKGWKRWLQG